MPVLPPEPTMSYPRPDFERKICAPEDLARAIATLPRPLVFTNGCFDLLHAGHVVYLEQAAKLGDRLVVGLNTDRSVRALKVLTRAHARSGDLPRAALFAARAGATIGVRLASRTRGGRR